MTVVTVMQNRKECCKKRRIYRGSLENALNLKKNGYLFKFSGRTRRYRVRSIAIITRRQGIKRISRPVFRQNVVDRRAFIDGAVVFVNRNPLTHCRHNSVRCALLRLLLKISVSRKYLYTLFTANEHPRFVGAVEFTQLLHTTRTIL